jgi:predicted transcriptional regulator
MACVSPDGKPTDSGRKMLEAAKELGTPEEIANLANLPLFKVRSGLRDLLGAGYLKEEQGKYLITDNGLNILKERK